ncbi:vang-like protein 1 [Diadema setosum]|uniref:vang-like protein 1 n=1 Tax=Diadema setosum TaxID=31175 RepID=UPI003B3BA811
MENESTGENPDDNGGFPVKLQEPPTARGSSRKSKYRDRDTDEESERSHRGRRGRRHRNRDQDSQNDGDRRRSKRVSGVPGERSVTIATAGATTDEDRDEVIEVQILPQDDNWGENTTAITGTSDRSSQEDLTRLAKDMDGSVGLDCTRYFSIIIAGALSLAAFLSPIAFVVLPSVMWVVDECGTSCDGLFISMAFKLFILLIGSWAVFFRKPKATLPRIYLFRLTMMGLIFTLLLAYWLFFVMRVITPQEPKYEGIVTYAVSLTDALLFLHYIAVILFELRHIHPVYMLKVVRSPDGLSRFYSIGQLSIQRSATFVLEQYYRDFQIYNSHLLRVPTTSRVAQKLSNFKFYDVDGVGNDSVTGHSRAIMTTAAHRRDQSRNERFYEEQEYERRMKKRKARLVVATEEAFTHIKRVHEDTHPGSHAMDPTEAAQSIFPSIARPLQKYLRITRQQPRWPMEAVIEHLALCVSYNLAPRSFLEAFFEPGPSIMLSEHCHQPTQGWELVSDTMVNRPLKEGTTFQLRQGEVSLQVFVMKVPHYKLNEEVYDYKRNRFALRLQSETSV